MSGPWKHQKPFLSPTVPARLPLPCPRPGFSSARCHQPLPQRCCGPAGPSLHHIRAWHGPPWSGPISRAALGPVLSVRTSPPVVGLCLTLVALTRPDPVPGLWVDFPVLPRACLITVDVPGGRPSRLINWLFSPACPAPLGGTPAGEVPGLVSVLSRSRPSFLGTFPSFP